jgi:hypothetical protein
MITLDDIYKALDCEEEEDPLLLISLLQEKAKHADRNERIANSKDTKLRDLARERDALAAQIVAMRETESGERAALRAAHERLREACVNPSGENADVYFCELCVWHWPVAVGKWPGQHAPTCPLASGAGKP